MSEIHLQKGLAYNYGQNQNKISGLKTIYQGTINKAPINSAYKVTPFGSAGANDKLATTPESCKENATGTTIFQGLTEYSTAYDETSRFQGFEVSIYKSMCDCQKDVDAMKYGFSKKANTAIQTQQFLLGIDPKIQILPFNGK